jgi:hypothetical protein
VLVEPCGQTKSWSAVQELVSILKRVLTWKGPAVTVQPVAPLTAAAATPAAATAAGEAAGAQQVVAAGDSQPSDPAAAAVVVKQEPGAAAAVTDKAPQGGAEGAGAGGGVGAVGGTQPTDASPSAGTGTAPGAIEAAPAAEPPPLPEVRLGQMGVLHRILWSVYNNIRYCYGANGGRWVTSHACDLCAVALQWFSHQRAPSAACIKC